MRSCDDFDNLLLESLYGLLESEEQEALRAHLATCPQCQAGLEVAKRHQHLLQQAAQVAPQVPLFTVPVDEPVPAIISLQATLRESPSPTAPYKRRTRLRWAMVAAAAALLVAVGGGHFWYQDQLDDCHRSAARTAKQVEALDLQIAQVGQQFQEKTATLPDEVQKPFVHLTLLTPAIYQPDAPSPVRVTTRNVHGQPVPSQVTVWLVRENAGKEDKQLLGKFTGANEFQVQLPPNLTGQLALEVEGRTEALKEPITLREILGRDQPAHVTHIALSKASYRIGEILFFRTLTLQQYSLQPPAIPRFFTHGQGLLGGGSIFQARATGIPLVFTLLDAKGQPRKQLYGETGPGGISGGELALTDDLADGEYTLEVAEHGDQHRVRPQRRRIEVQRGLDPEIRFDRGQYKPGDPGVVYYRSRRLPTGGVQANQPVIGAFTVDGKPMNAPGSPPAGGPVQRQTDDKGVAVFPFQLPEKIETGKAQIEVQEYGLRREKVQQPIPVVVPKRAVEFFPEGGDLVAGIPTRVYYRVQTPLGEPMPPEGYVNLMTRKSKEGLLDSDWKQSTGVFLFTPQLDETYELRITWPKNNQDKEQNWLENTDPFKDVPIQIRGLNLSVEGVTREGEPLPVVLRNTDVGKRLLVLATCRGRVVDQRLVDVPVGTTREHKGRLETTPSKVDVPLQPVAGATGVVRVTVFEPRDNGNLIPLAERLVYRIPAQTLNLSAKASKENYRPGEKVYLDVRARDETGAASLAWGLGVVVDEKVAPRQPGLPAHFYLLSEIRQGHDLDNADLVVADAAPAGRQALDLFLGTQGWRRVVAEKPEPALVAKAGKAKKEKPQVLTDDVPVILCKENSEPALLADAYQTAYAKALAQLREPLQQQLHRLHADRQARALEARLAAGALADMENLPRELLWWGWVVLVVGLWVAGCLALALGLRRLARQTVAPRPALVSAMVLLCSALVLYAVVGKQWERGLAGDNRAFAQKPVPSLPAGKLPGVQPVPPVSGLFAARPLSLPDNHGPTVVVSRDFPVMVAKDTTQDGGASREDETSDGKKDTNAYTLSPELGARFLNLAMDQKAKAKMPPAKGGGKILAAPSMARYFAPQVKVPAPIHQDTVLWAPTLVLPDEVSFFLPQHATTYRIMLYANSPSGRLGFFQGTLAVK